MSEEKQWPRPEGGELLSRALHLRCPRCGQDPLFAGWFQMHKTCSTCGFRYEPAPGYFLGSIYLNYAFTAVLTTIAYVSLHFGAGYSNRTLTIPLVALCVGFPLFFFRYARALWLAMDAWFDKSVLEQTGES